jgi:hypothetical protein
MTRNKPFIVAALAFASLIVAPAISSVNFDLAIPVAEGSPLPAPSPKPPLSAVGGIVVAEGSPLPAPSPKPPLASTGAVFVAEGSPLPAPSPKPPVQLA